MATGIIISCPPSPERTHIPIFIDSDSGSGEDPLIIPGPPGLAGESGISAYFSQPFTNQTSVTVTHNFGVFPVVQILDDSNEVLIPQSIVNNSINDLTVTFNVSTSGTIILTVGSSAVPGPVGPQGIPGVGTQGLPGPVIILESELPEDSIIPGPQGLTGVGIQGIPGQVILLEPDLPDDPIMIPGPQGPAGNISGAGSGYLGSTNDTLVVQVGSVTFTTQAGLPLLPGNRIRLTWIDAWMYYPIIAWMEGAITAYSGTSMTVNVDLIGEAGSYSVWNISLAGQPGIQGERGPVLYIEPDTPEDPIIIPGMNGGQGSNGSTILLEPDQPEDPPIIPGPQGIQGTSGPGTGLYLDGYTCITKPADQDVTNNGTPQDDTDFQFAVIANHRYDVLLHLIYAENNSSVGYAFDFTVSAGTMYGAGTGTTGVGSIFRCEGGTSTTTIQINPGTGELTAICGNLIRFSFIPSNNCTFKFQFCNYTPVTGRISRTCKNSKLYYADVT
jgi:hypothetical protein